MIRRAFWFTTGAAAGIWATTRVQRTLRALAPDSLAHRAADRALAAGHRARDFARDVRVGMAQREHELNEALGLTAGEPPAPAGALAPPPPRPALGPAPAPAAPPAPLAPGAPQRTQANRKNRSETRKPGNPEKRTTDGVG
ncbi:DUF6167 family protein [Streptomyces hoynatensis]|uniref:DUF6167 family protein n=1 Tax=Streptomyces hoynatensis TaxID=1141874 RepID=UPI001F4D6C54|nr:DUF6167 family protein [Streptomyces hoynatensis]